MSQAPSLKFVSLLGSPLAGSFNAVVARNLDLLAPECVEVSALGSVGDIPTMMQTCRLRDFLKRLLQWEKR